MSLRGGLMPPTQTNIRKMYLCSVTVLGLLFMTSPFKCTRVKLVNGYIAALYGSRTRPLVDSLLNSAGCVSVIDLIRLNSKTPL